MNREVFMMLASELRPYPQPGNSPRGQDVLSVEKRLAVTFYYLKDQSSLAMTANAFGVALCAVSVVVRKVCDVVMVLRPQFIKLPSIPQEMATIGKFFGLKSSKVFTSFIRVGRHVVSSKFGGRAKYII